MERPNLAESGKYSPIACPCLHPDSLHYITQPKTRLLQQGQPHQHQGTWNKFAGLLEKSHICKTKVFLYFLWRALCYGARCYSFVFDFFHKRLLSDRNLICVRATEGICLHLGASRQGNRQCFLFLGARDMSHADMPNRDCPLLWMPSRPDKKDRGKKGT